MSTVITCSPQLLKMLEHSVRPSPAAWADYQEGWGRSRPSIDTGLEAACSHTCGSCQRATQHALWQGRPLGMGRECRSCRKCQWKQTMREKVPSNALGWNILASANRDCHSARYWTMLAKGFSQGSGFGERWGSVLLQSDPFSHSLLGYLSGNEIPTHKEAKH